MYYASSDELVHYGVKGMEWGKRKRKDDPANQPSQATQAAAREYLNKYQSYRRLKAKYFVGKARRSEMEKARIEATEKANKYRAQRMAEMHEAARVASENASKMQNEQNQKQMQMEEIELDRKKKKRKSDISKAAEAAREKASELQRKRNEENKERNQTKEVPDFTSGSSSKPSSRTYDHNGRISLNKQGAAYARTASGKRVKLEKVENPNGTTSWVNPEFYKKLSTRSASKSSAPSRSNSSYSSTTHTKVNGSSRTHASSGSSHSGTSKPSTSYSSSTHTKVNGSSRTHASSGSSHSGTSKKKKDKR